MNEGIMQGNLSRRDFYHRVFYEKWNWTKVQDFSFEI
jgi:hypothetical protein